MSLPVELSAGPLSLAVAPHACGAITRFRYADGPRTIELLRPASSEAIATRDPRGMALFPLVPFSNRIGHGRFNFQGRDISLPANFPPEPHAVHGHGWQNPWQVVERDATRLTIEYLHGAGAWPFAYRARQHYALTPDFLALTFSVRNESADPMPAGFGVHPYFERTPDATIQAGVGGMWQTDEQSLPTALVPVPESVPLATGLNPDAVPLDTNFSGFDGVADIHWPGRGASMRIETQGPFTCLVVYTPPGQPFFCVEPVTNCIDAFNLAAAGRDDTGMLVLDPGATVTGTVRFTPTVRVQVTR